MPGSLTLPNGARVTVGHGGKQASLEVEYQGQKQVAQFNGAGNKGGWLINPGTSSSQSHGHTGSFGTQGASQETSGGSENSTSGAIGVTPSGE